MWMMSQVTLDVDEAQIEELMQMEVHDLIQVGKMHNEHSQC